MSSIVIKYSEVSTWIQSHRNLFWLHNMLLNNDEWECKSENYAYVLVILTAVTFALSLDWSDWFCLWENLPVCLCFRVDMYETQLFPWLLKGEQAVKPGFLTSKCLLQWFTEVVIILALPNYDFLNLHFLVLYFQ